MSYQYDEYLKNHRENVAKGYNWIKQYLPHLVDGKITDEWQFAFNHDESKNNSDEYRAYDEYFYGGYVSFAVDQAFERAWLRHIHRNPHHWQHWVLINDDPKEGEIVLKMPYNYTLEMVCDWWTFSWSKDKLDEIFSWYDERKDYIKLHKNTRKEVEYILSEIKKKLEELDERQ